MGSSSSSTSRQENIQQFVENSIASEKVIVFSKSWCGYCRRAKSFLRDQLNGQELTVVELDERADGNEIQDYLAQKTNQYTVPNIFINTKHIGGSDALQKLHNEGKLAPLLK